MGRTQIEWADAVWNPVTGCSKVSRGCDNCYAERMARRLAGMGTAKYSRGFRPTTHPKALDEPIRWKQPRRILVCSMGDLFHEEIWTGFVHRVLDVIERCPQHTFLILTKRPRRMRRLLVARSDLPNLWLGVTAEDQSTADDRIPELLRSPAAVRFVSCEPLLGPVNLSQFLLRDPRRPTSQHRRLDWVIAGGETGPGARPMHPDWARRLRDDCIDADVPFFFKQWGEYAPSDYFPSLQEPGPIKCLPGRSPGRVTRAGLVTRVGRRKAGRLLDHVAWCQTPE